MKNSGLQYRFDPLDKDNWMFWHRCMWCGKNKWDCLHHIISPSSMNHRHGDFNSSILNSSPMHNHGCHLDNGQLHHVNIEIKLLDKTFQALKIQGYKLKEIDLDFIEAYRKTHFNHINDINV